MVIICFFVSIVEVVITLRKSCTIVAPSKKNLRTSLLLILIIVWNILYFKDMNTNLAPQALTDIKIYQKLMEREMRVLVGYKLRAEEWNTRLNGYKDN